LINAGPVFAQEIRTPELIQTKSLAANELPTLVASHVETLAYLDAETDRTVQGATQLLMYWFNTLEKVKFISNTVSADSVESTEKLQSVATIIKNTYVMAREIAAILEKNHTFAQSALETAIRVTQELNELNKTIDCSAAVEQAVQLKERIADKALAINFFVEKFSCNHRLEELNYVALQKLENLPQEPQQ
jgi:hypothetical protein